MKEHIKVPRVCQFHHAAIIYGRQHRNYPSKCWLLNAQTLVSWSALPTGKNLTTPHPLRYLLASPPFTNPTTMLFANQGISVALPYYNVYIYHSSPCKGLYRFNLGARLGCNASLTYYGYTNAITASDQLPDTIQFGVQIYCFTASQGHHSLANRIVARTLQHREQVPRVMGTASPTL